MNLTLKFDHSRLEVELEVLGTGTDTLEHDLTQKAGLMDIHFLKNFSMNGTGMSTSPPNQRMNVI